MTKKILLCISFFVLTPLTILISLQSMAVGKGEVLGERIEIENTIQSVYASVPETISAVAATISAADATPVVIDKYLKRYGSPLPADEILKAAEKYGVNPRLIVAIAQQESNLGKKSPPDCNNAWGYGIHKQGTLCFNSWAEAIDTVTKGIKKNYCDKGLCEDACEMMKKYTPSSNGSWCNGVNQFLSDMETGNF